GPSPAAPSARAWLHQPLAWYARGRKSISGRPPLPLPGLSASDVQNGVRVRGAILEDLHRFRGGAHDQLDAALLRFRLDFLHDRQMAEHARADHQALALPRNLFLGRYGSVPELFAKLPRLFLAAPAQSAAIQDDVLGVLLAVNLERTDLVLAPLHEIPLSF